VVVRARLFAADAPRAVARFAEALPLAEPLRQSRWSGNSTFVSMPRVRDADLQAERTAIPPERPATFMTPGRLYLGLATGGLGLPYGEAQSRDVGVNTWLVELGELEGDVGPFLERLRRVRREGATRLRITPLP
jgi:hypothetical protein